MQIFTGENADIKRYILIVYIVLILFVTIVDMRKNKIFVVFGLLVLGAAILFWLKRITGSLWIVGGAFVILLLYMFIPWDKLDPSDILINLINVGLVLTTIYFILIYKLPEQADAIMAHMARIITYATAIILSIFTAAVIWHTTVDINTVIDIIIIISILSAIYLVWDYEGKNMNDIPKIIIGLIIGGLWTYAIQPHRIQFPVFKKHTKMLLKGPVPLYPTKYVSVKHPLDYSHNITFDIFIDSNQQDQRKTLYILQHGNEITIKYVPNINTIIIENQICVIGRIKNVPLQKWNNFTINLINGTTDVFFNNKLVLSKSGCLPKGSEGDKDSDYVIGNPTTFYGNMRNLNYQTIT